MKKLDINITKAVDAVVDKLLKELGDNLVSVWLYDWKDISDPDYSIKLVIRTVDGKDTSYDEIQSWAENAAYDAGWKYYMPVSVHQESSFEMTWYYFIRDFAETPETELKYYDREEGLITRPDKFCEKTTHKTTDKYSVRKATDADKCRIAEIEVFNQRLNFYPLCKNDEYYFGKLQVSEELGKRNDDDDDEYSMKNTYVYDDGVVKGFIVIEDGEVWKLFVEPALQGQSVGSELMKFAKEVQVVHSVWVPEKNTRGVKFYEKQGFSLTEERIFEATSREYLIRMKRS